VKLLHSVPGGRGERDPIENIAALACSILEEKPMLGSILQHADWALVAANGDLLLRFPLGRETFLRRIFDYEFLILSHANWLRLGKIRAANLKVAFGRD
jgi:hypothetical protein